MYSNTLILGINIRQHHTYETEEIKEIGLPFFQGARMENVLCQLMTSPAFFPLRLMLLVTIPEVGKSRMWER